MSRLGTSQSRHDPIGEYLGYGCAFQKTARADGDEDTKKGTITVLLRNAHLLLLSGIVSDCQFYCQDWFGDSEERFSRQFQVQPLVSEPQK